MIGALTTVILFRATLRHLRVEQPWVTVNAYKVPVLYQRAILIIKIFERKIMPRVSVVLK